MTQIMIWKLATDIGLVLSLMFFAYRFFRSRAPAVNIAELQELNSRLKAAVREADEAGRALSDQLQSRKQSLEKMLFDLETVEHRLNRSVTSAEEQKGSLEIVIKRATSLARESSSQSTWDTAEKRLPRNELEMIVEEPAAPAFATALNPPVSEQSRINDWSKESAHNRVEVISPPIQSAPPKRPNPYIALSEVVEKEVDSSTAPANVAASMEEIYTIAEKLLQTGRTLDEVAARTRLPIDELRMISQVIEREKLIEDEIEEEVIPASNKDSRLGVLGGIKRQTQLL